MTVGILIQPWRCRTVAGTLWLAAGKNGNRPNSQQSKSKRTHTP